MSEPTPRPRPPHRNPAPETERRLLRIQAFSGSIFLVFALVHLANAAMAARGVDAYQGWLGAARTIYQQPIVEIGLLMLPLAVHWSAGLLRLRRSGFRRRNRSLRARLHRYSGWFLLAFVWGHVLATRAPSLLADVEVGFSTISYTFAWLPAWFYPYYATLALCGLYHGANGALLPASIAGRPIPVGLRYGPGFWVPFSAAALLVLLGLAGLAGLLYPIPDPFESGYARLMAEWTGSGAGGPG